MESTLTGAINTVSVWEGLVKPWNCLLPGSSSSKQENYQQNLLEIHIARWQGWVSGVYVAVLLSEWNSSSIGVQC